MTATPVARLPLGERLVRRRVLGRRALALALGHQEDEEARLGEVLVAHGMTAPEEVARTLSEDLGARFIRLDRHWCDESLLAGVDAEAAARHRVLPLRRAGNRLVVAMADPADPAARAFLADVFALDVLPVLATAADIAARHQRAFAGRLLDESVSGLQRRLPAASAHLTLTRGQAIFFGSASLVLLALAAIFRTGFFIGATAFVTLAYTLVVGFRFYVTLVGSRGEQGWRVTQGEIAALRDFPVYTVLCPLYREAGVLPQLVRGIAALDYPKSKLDVKLLVEADDAETLAVVRGYRLPAYFDVVVVPAVGQRTKPKACNYGLQLARGEYVVIYDAEDIPEPDQLKKALAMFRRGEPGLACVQARLNYYNARQNTLTGWFTIEYLSWFDYFLPGLVRLGLPVPLGGSSNHLLTEAVRELGGWDPNNVTEDADLGMRLHRRGYRTTVIDSVTWEEANSDLVNWMRQRSRWGKGYLVSWLVQMRDPRAALRELGWKGLLSMQFTLLGTFLISLLNLVMWLMTLTWILTRLQFIADLFPGWIYYPAMIQLLVGNFALMYLSLVVITRRKLWHLDRLAVMTPGYWLMMSLAMIKAALQVVQRPGFWEKTEHGLFTTQEHQTLTGFAALAAAERRAGSRRA